MPDTKTMRDPRPHPHPDPHPVRRERHVPLLGGLVDLVIEPCACPGDDPCDFAACPRRGLPDPVNESEAR